MYHNFLNYLFTDGHLRCFQHLAIVNNAAMNIGMHIFFLIGVMGFLEYIPRSGIAGSNDSAILVFWGNSILFSTMPASVWIPTKCTRVPFSSRPRQHLLFVDLFMMPHSDQCELVSHCSFNLYLVMLSIFSYVSGPSVCPPWRSVCSSPLPIFN